MNDERVDRVREDLEAMKQAVGTELPFGTEDLKWGWFTALVFVPLAVWSLLGPGTYMSLAIVLSLLAVLPAELAFARKHRQQRNRHPGRWRETRLKTLVELGSAPLVILIWVWAIANGAPVNMMVGLVLAVGGGVLTFMGLFSRRRLAYVGLGITTIACGLAMPGATDQQVGLALALMFIVGSTASTAIAAWQVRDVESGHATN